MGGHVYPERQEMEIFYSLPPGDSIEFVLSPVFFVGLNWAHVDPNAELGLTL